MGLKMGNGDCNAILLENFVWIAFYVVYDNVLENFGQSVWLGRQETFIFGYMTSVPSVK